MVSHAHPIGTSAEAWRGPLPSGPGYTSCGQRCPDCEQVIQVAGTWDDWDRIHGSICARGQMVLPLGDADDS